jgi:tetratricopeptide (TPR) repeat protein
MLAMSYFNIATMYQEREDAQRSLDASGKAAEYWSRLVDVAPSVTSYQVDLAGAYYLKAWTEHQLGRESDSMASADRALKIYNRLLNDDPENLEHQVQKGFVLNHEGVIHDEARRNEQANQTLQQAVQLRRSILRKSSGIDNRKVDLCVSLENLGETYVDRGDVEQGLSHYREALSLRQELCAAHPEDRVTVLDLVDAWVVIGNILRQHGNPKGALEAYDHAGAALESLLKSNPNDGELQGKRGRVLERKANVLDDEGQSGAAIEMLNQAAGLVRAALKEGAKGGKPREVLSEVLWNLARLLQATGKNEDASHREDEQKALWNERLAADLFELAKMQAVRADLIGYGKSPISPAGERVRTLDRNQAAASLRRALELGFKDVARLSSHPDIAPLLEREDIKPLFAGLPRPDKP